MDHASVETIVREHLPRLSQRLGLSGWEISIECSDKASDGDGTLHRGECTRLVDYQSAHIWLNPSAFADESAVLTTLRHELLHVVLAPFDLFTSAVEELRMPDVAGDILDRIRDHAVERAVAGLERMWSGLSESQTPLGAESP